ncbi:MAG: PD-(D/E)XK nuclease family protein [Kastovskya adunca ATA6-11-RM4]|nr:PD-(D/E)XK nuclease family protein [Kastovskya adunca ATA6-11-RM4]
MYSTPTPLWRLSQGQLNLLATCPRKFQHIYFEQLGSPVSPEQLERQGLGSRFHLLMQQRELGLPVERLAQEDAQMHRWVTALVETAPEILQPNPESFRDSEHLRTVVVQDYLLTVIYDLLIADTTSAQILDWKTYLRPKDRRSLAKDWQTRLYLYVLAETSDYLPEQLSMSYWFVQSRPEPQSEKFTYNSTQHEQTRQDLRALLTQLTSWRERYQTQGIDFPQVAPTVGDCQTCNFVARCDRTEESLSTNEEDRLRDLADIQEVSL